MTVAVRSALARSLLCLPCALVLFAYSNARAAGSLRPDGAELLYLAALAVVIGGLAGLLAALVAAADHAAPDRPVRVALGVALLGLPFALALSDYAKFAEGLRSKGVPLGVAQAGYATLTLALILAVWAQQRFARTPRATYLTAVPFAAGLAEFGARHGFTSRRLGLLLALCATVVMANACARALEGRASQLMLAGSAAALVLGCALAIVAVPSALAGGRRRAVVRTSILAHLDRSAGVFGEPHVGYRGPGGAPAACKAAPVVATPPLGLSPAQRRNVVLVSIDTVRADDATLQVAGRPLMPTLSRFKQSAWAAPAAYTGYPATMMALSSAFSGLLPSRVVLSGRPAPSVFGAGRGRFDDMSAFVPDGPYFRRPAIERFLIQGARRVPVKNAQTQTSLAIKHLRKLRKAQASHLLWVHYYEPHEPYVKHRGFDFGASERERYHSELAYIDRELGKLLRELEKQHVYDDTLVIVFSDHGESFGEHGQVHHHYQLYPWLTRVPFALRVPGQAPRTLAGPVHLTDIAATVLDFAGLPAALPLDGQSLLRGDPAADRLLISEEFPIQSRVLEQLDRAGMASARAVEERIDLIERSPGYATKVSVVKGSLQSVVHTAVNAQELYRLDRDPLAEHDLADSEPALRDALRAELDAYYARVAPAIGCVPQAAPAELARSRN